MMFTDQDLEIVELPQREAMDKCTGLNVVACNKKNETEVEVGIIGAIINVLTGKGGKH